MGIQSTENYIGRDKFYQRFKSTNSNLQTLVSILSYNSQRRGISACYSPLKKIKSTAVVVHGNTP